VERAFEAQWKSSGHADATAEAFVHWDEDDPAVVSEGCAKYHSSYEYQDLLGVDGSEDLGFTNIHYLSALHNLSYDPTDCGGGRARADDPVPAGMATRHPPLVLAVHRV